MCISAYYRKTVICVSFSFLAHCSTCSAEQAQISVNTPLDRVDGDTSSIASLNGNPGGDGGISLAEAIAAANGDAQVVSEVTIDISLGAGVAIKVLNPLPVILRNNLSIHGDGVILDGNSCSECDGIQIQGAYNLIEGVTFVRFEENGVRITGTSAIGNTIQKCIIGIVDETPLPNGLGVLIDSGASQNAIEDSVISANRYGGISIVDLADDNRLYRNLIGITADGLSAIPNGYEIIPPGLSSSTGIYIYNATKTRIGAAPDSGNVVSGYHTNSMVIFGEESSGTRVHSNTIKLHERVIARVPDIDVGGGITLGLGTSDIEIGGIDPAQGNSVEIFGNAIAIAVGGQSSTKAISRNVLIANNTLTRSMEFFETLGSGVAVAEYTEGVTIGAGNDISNFRYGISLWSKAEKVMIFGNAIYNNKLLGIGLRAQNAVLPPPPVISSEAPYFGTTSPCARVELYLDETNQGHYYIGAVYADAQGQFPLVAPEDADPALNVTAIATDRYGNSSAFSAPVSVALVARGTLPEDPAPGACANLYHASADYNQDLSISLEEILRLIQLYNALGYSCGTGTEDGYQPGPGARDCTPHSSDYLTPDWAIDLDELMRILQFYNAGAYEPCEGSEDGFCPVFRNR